MSARAKEMVKKAIGPGGRFNFDPGQLRLLNAIAQSIVEGTPVSKTRVAQLAQTAGVDLGAAEQFLAGISESDANGNIVGIVPGLTLTRTRHRLTVAGKKLFTYCAGDALHAAPFLNQTVEIESRTPLLKETVRLTVSPQRIESVSPSETVISMVIVDLDHTDLSSLTAIWTAFCHNIHFFSSRKEAKEWSRGRDDIEILSPEEGYELFAPMAKAFTIPEVPARA